MLLEIRYLHYPKVNKLVRELWKLNKLKLHTALKKKGLNPTNVEWLVNAIETGVIKLPEIQSQRSQYLLPSYS
jgi:hypothetical protein